LFSFVRSFDSGRIFRHSAIKTILGHSCGVKDVACVDRERRTIWIVEAHGYGRRFIVRADEKLTAFVELELAIRVGGKLS
jgi:hypothetical protein